MGEIDQAYVTVVAETILENERTVAGNLEEKQSPTKNGEVNIFILAPFKMGDRRITAA